MRHLSGLCPKKLKVYSPIVYSIMLLVFLLCVHGELDKNANKIVKPCEIKALLSFFFGAPF